MSIHFQRFKSNNLSFLKTEATTASRIHSKIKSQNSRTLESEETPQSDCKETDSKKEGSTNKFIEQLFGSPEILTVPVPVQGKEAASSKDFQEEERDRTKIGVSSSATDFQPKAEDPESRGKKDSPVRVPESEPVRQSSEETDQKRTEIQKDSGEPGTAGPTAESVKQPTDVPKPPSLSDSESGSGSVAEIVESESDVPPLFD